MTRDNIFAAELFRAAIEAVEFQISVAVYAGVRGRTALIGFNKAAHDLLFEIRSEIKDIIRHPESVGDAARIFRIFERAAALFAADPCVLVIKKLHRHADAVKPAFNREIGGDGRIHSAAHRDERLAARVIEVKAHILPLKKARKPRRKSRSLWENYLSVLKKRSRQIAVACVRQEHNYRLALVLRALCKLYCCISGGA